ncbi:hypothetical protein V0M98_32475 (plasmid) [Pseudomonas silesiensis]|uniref:hypothetical protein n=1 Tax=Pseudomonas silesiensis TaxID=1853130 RepID=UPI0030CB0E46
MSNYQPKRASARWLEDAPPYVLSIHDSGEKVNDRYTVCFGWPLWEERMGRTVPYLGFNEVPTSPNMGVSMWGECDAHRQGLGKKIRWNDLPVEMRKHVKARVEGSPDGVIVAILRHDLTLGWFLKSQTGQTRYGSYFKTKTSALQYAKEHLIVLAPPPPIVG